MRDMKVLIDTKGNNIPLHVKKFESIAEYIAWIFNNADKFPITNTQPDNILVSLEELVAFGYKLGYHHGLDYMDGKRPTDATLQYTEYTEGGE